MTVTRPATRPTHVGRILAIIYGAVCYLMFLVAFLYAVGLVGDIVVPRSVDHAIIAPTGQAIVVNLLLRCVVVKFEDKPEWDVTRPENTE